MQQAVDFFSVMCESTMFDSAIFPVMNTCDVSTSPPCFHKHHSGEYPHLCHFFEAMKISLEFIPTSAIARSQILLICRKHCEVIPRKSAPVYTFTG